MEAVEFRAQLESLEEGDTITFVFKGRKHWATDFLALFNVEPFFFKVSDESVMSFETIDLYMMAKWISTSSWSVICNVLRNPNQSQISIDWIIEHIFPLLNDFTVHKASKPE
jgi:hypothetical protein